MRSRRTLLTQGAATLALATVGFPALTARTAAAATYDGYVMGYFTESPTMVGARYALHLAASRDGLNWVPLNQNQPVAIPTAGTGGLRDPFIMRRQDGTFIVLATDLNGTDFGQNNQYIHAWDSVDLRSFTGYRRLRLHDRTAHTWAPEAFWDGSRGQYGILYSANIDGRDSFWVNYTSDFRTVSAAQEFFYPGFGVLDATMHTTPNGNYLYYKNLANGRLYGARSATLQPRSFDSGTYTAGVISGAIEAPIVHKDNTRDRWYLWGDSFSPVNGELYVWASDDITRDGWTPVGKFDYTQPLNAKHATICPLTLAEHDNLVARWGTPAWRRIRSHNLPDHLIRHRDLAGRVDPYPFDPYQDSQWRLVAGLADAGAVSFESVNYPGRFLRHFDHVIRLDPNDGTAVFAADATFHRVPGLADASWTSFRSHNFPDRYLRHADYLLRTDPLSASSPATDRADATFQVGY
ncbi:glycoside hydrolase family 43 protein [Streptomyces hainanensis]|uniref:Alpha-L-arabinofuranosidase n=1 Tax=Streptomyces hainanensis TaxID=402648 RepID=A0A4V2Y3C2_9ACTN|nr:glycoside hydrolase family 43 protein [Streptomyces hainanensis]TDC75955.1 alpha-L-arabinofuranosidase [Streptomyces hainanensis]